MPGANDKVIGGEAVIIRPGNNLFMPDEKLRIGQSPVHTLGGTIIILR